MATNVGAFNQQTAASRAAEQIKARAKELSKLHPIAIVVIVLASLLILAGAAFTGFHNYELYRRTTSSPMIALVPPMLLDGSMILLLVGFIFWFTSPIQKVVAALFNLALFVIVGVNTSLNGSLNSGVALNNGMQLYLEYGIIASFLLTLGSWMLIFHLDPMVKRNEERAKLNAEAQSSAHAIEIDQMKLQMENDKAELEYRLALAVAMHSARMKALGSEDVKDALVDLEKQQALIEARDIRGSLPLPKDPKAPGRQ